MKKVAILDRDGTICEENGYIPTGGELKILPYAAEAIKRLNDDGWIVVGASNQSGVARGYTTKAWVEQVNQHMIAKLAQQGAKLERVYFCPHHPLEDCGCRKPRPGMIEQIMKDYQVGRAECVMVGDKDCDVEMGKAAGLTTVLVLTGYGEQTHGQFVGEKAPDYSAKNLLDAAGWITAHARRPASMKS